MKTLAWFFSLAALVAQAAEPAAPIRIEQIVYVYSPHADREGAFSLYDTPAMLAQWATQHGMDVTLVNADDVYTEAKDWDSRKGNLLATLRNLGQSRNTIYWIATHGKELPSEQGSDTQLTIFDKYEHLTYSELAKVLDPMATARGVIVDACHGYCDALKNSAKRGAGKLVASVATQDKGGTYEGAHVLAQSLAQLIGSSQPVKLGADFYTHAERVVANCAKAERTTDKSDKAPVASGLFAALPTDPKERMQCADQKLTISDGLGNQKFSFGGGAGKIRDAFGRNVKLCRSLGSGLTTPYIPGRIYGITQVFGDPIRRDGTYPSVKNSAFDAFYFECQPSGQWGLVRDSYRRASHARCEDDPKCEAPEHKRIKIASCRQPMWQLLNESSPTKHDGDYEDEDSGDSPNAECLRYQDAYAEFVAKKVDLGNWDTTTLCLTQRTENRLGGEHTVYGWCPIAKDRAAPKPKAGSSARPADSAPQH